ncbi:MAG: sensor histidine kinase [Spirochaetia bacterium]
MKIKLLLALLLVFVLTLLIIFTLPADIEHLLLSGKQALLQLFYLLSQKPGLAVLPFAVGAIGFLFYQRVDDRERLLRLAENKYDLETKMLKRDELINTLISRYSMLFETANDAILLMQDVEIIDCNAMAADLFDCNRIELIGKTVWDISPAEQPNGKASEEAGLEYLEYVKKYGHHRFQWLQKTIDGFPFYAELSMNYIYLEGKHYFQVILHDISEQRNALQEKEVMLREIHHRVMNNLQVLHSLINLQSRDVTTLESTQILRKTQRRIYVMYLIHEMLYKNDNLAIVSIKEFITQIESYIKNMYSKNIHLKNRGPEAFDISLEKGVPLGIIVGELLANIYQHAKSDNSLTAFISYKKENNAFVLTVSDSGQGLECDNQGRPAKRGLGFLLVDACLNQLKGSMTCKNDEGFHVTIRFPYFPSNI